MGTDLHLQVEFRRDDSSPWKLAQPPVGAWGPCWYSPRRYDAFAILANVRNGYGFAGHVTGEGFRPISDPRGLPEDISPALVNSGWLGDHSFSWLLLSEVLGYDYGQVTTKRGVVNSEQFKEARATGRATSWSGGVAGPGVENITPDEMAKRIDAGSCTGKEYTEVFWQTTYREAMGGYLHFFEILPELLGVWKSQNIRLVFGFDS